MNVVRAKGIIKFLSNAGKKKSHLRDGGERKPLMKSLSEGINFISGKKQIKQNYS